MPGFDRTGPRGIGQAGRGLGPCGGGQSRGGRGRRLFHRAAGWGLGQRFSADPIDKETLEEQKSWLETQLAEIQQRLQELAGDTHSS